MTKTFYRRNLPHWHPINQSFFLTWRLSGSLPKSVIEELQAIRLHLGTKKDVTAFDARVIEFKKMFARIDRILDKAETGPTWLAIPEVADMVQKAIVEGYAYLYKLWAYVIMANHLHVLLKPKPGFSLEIITKHLKGFTAHEAHLLLGRSGETFWQDECFDHWPRDDDEFFRIVDYIENNPVKAGLVTKRENWLWSSAAERKRRGWKRFRALT
jgi:putative transposase